MFSSRTRWDRTENRLSRLAQARRRAGLPLLDLTESNPTRAGLVAPPDVLATLTDPRALTYEPSPTGLQAAREAVATDFGRRGFAVDAGRVVLTASTSEAYAFLFKLLADPGDAVLVPRPSYPLFDFLARLESLDVHPYALAFDGEWHLSLPAIEAALSPRTRAIVVVNPNNPTGSYLKRDEVSGLMDLCARRGLAVVSDEVFADYAFAPDSRRLTSVAADAPALAFSLGGLSKSCGLPQLKLGWIAVTGPEPLRNEALARLEIVADTYLSVATPVQHAAPALLARLRELQAPIARRVQANLASLRARLGADSPATLLPAEGGWNAVLRVPATLPEEERVCRLLETRGVLVHPGFFFDFEHEAFLVLSLLPEPAVFAEGVEHVLADVAIT
jgi:aspartate/methionine/tyrosine aminotransferase